jgi:hypothetical protein
MREIKEIRDGIHKGKTNKPGSKTKETEKWTRRRRKRKKKEKKIGVNMQSETERIENIKNALNFCSLTCPTPSILQNTH